jgi:hypothetical protein
VIEIQDGRWKEEDEVIPFQLRGRYCRRAEKKKKKKRKRREEKSVRGRAPPPVTVAAETIGLLVVSGSLGV